MEIDNIKWKYSPKKAPNILDKMVTFQQQETIEIKNRIRAAWAAFYKDKQELTSKSYFLRHRLRLFDMVITSTMNHASGTWTLSKEHERENQSTQRKMLRLVIQTRRKYKKKTHDKNGEKAQGREKGDEKQDEKESDEEMKESQR